MTISLQASDSDLTKTTMFSSFSSSNNANAPPLPNPIITESEGSDEEDGKNRKRQMREKKVLASPKSNSKKKQRGIGGNDVDDENNDDNNTVNNDDKASNTGSSQPTQTRRPKFRFEFTHCIPVLGGAERAALQSIFCNSEARKIIRPFADKAIAIVQEENLLFNPMNPQADDFVKQKLTGESQLYAYSREKIGQTANMHKRRGYTDEEKQNMIRCICRFNLLSTKGDHKLREITMDFIRALATAGDLHHCQREFYRLINGGLWEFGLVTQVARQLCEAGANYLFGITDNPLELGMCDGPVINNREKKVQSAFDGGKHLFDNLKEKSPNRVVTTFVVSSWATAAERYELSAKPAINKYVVPSQHGKKRWGDTIPYPAVPGGKGDDFFSRDYSEEELESGMDDLKKFIEHAVKRPLHGIIDFNELVMGNVNKTLKLVRDGGGNHPCFFKLEHIVFDHEVFVFSNKDVGTVLQVHFPLHKMMCSWKIQGHDDKILQTAVMRSMTAEYLAATV